MINLTKVCFYDFENVYISTITKKNNFKPIYEYIFLKKYIFFLKMFLFWVIFGKMHFAWKHKNRGQDVSRKVH